MGSGPAEPSILYKHLFWGGVGMIMHFSSPLNFHRDSFYFELILN